MSEDAIKRGSQSSRRVALLSARWLCKYYGTGLNRLVVLNNLNLEVAEKELIAIVGASGAGKSTLLHLLGGLDRPTSGSVEFYGFDIFSVAGVHLPRLRNGVVGFMFQFHHLLPEFTALENVMMPMLIGGRGFSESKSRAAEVLGQVSLGDRRTHRPAELSGGEQQRVALARALVNEPRILLADEPTGNLDSRSGDEIFGLLRELLESRGLTAIVVTHNERLAARCDRILRLEDGYLR